MSEVRANTLSDAAGTGPTTLTKQAASKAHSTTTFSGGTPTLRDSLNVSSLTDTANGRLTINLTNAFAAAVGPGVLTSNGPQASGFGTDRGYHSTAFFVDASTIGQASYNGSSDSDPEVETASGMGDLA